MDHVYDKRANKEHTSKSVEAELTASSKAATSTAVHLTMEVVLGFFAAGSLILLDV